MISPPRGAFFHVFFRPIVSPRIATAKRSRQTSGTRQYELSFSFISFLGFTTLICQSPIRTWRLSRTVVEIPQKREAYCCRVLHTCSSTIWERNKMLKLGMKMGKDIKRIPNKYAHICLGFFLTPFPTSPPYANFTSAKNDLQY